MPAVSLRTATNGPNGTLDAGLIIRIPIIAKRLSVRFSKLKFGFIK
jgi:hypothetical protein